MPSTAQSHSRLSRLHAGSGLDRPFAVRVSHRPVCRRRRAARFIARTTAGLSSRPSLLPQRALRPCPPCSADHRGTARLVLAGRSVGSRPSRPPAATNADRLTSPATAVTPPQPCWEAPAWCAVLLRLEKPNTRRQSHRSSDQGADWPVHSVRTVHATARSSGTHPRLPCPPNPPPARPYPAHVDSKKRRSEQRRRLRRAAPAQQAGANRIIAVAVARATSTCRPRTSVRPSERETVPLDARRRVASLGATAERVGLGVNSYRREAPNDWVKSAICARDLFTRPEYRPSSTTKPAHRRAAAPTDDSRWFRCLEPSVKISNA